MNRFGVDKPDVRFGLELVDLSDTFRNSAFKVFQSTVAGGGVIKALNAKGLADLTQGELKNLEDIAKSLGAKGLAFIKVEGGEWKSPIVKFFSEAEKAELTRNSASARGHHLLRGGAVGKGVRHSRPAAARGGAASDQKRGKLTLPPR
jgi:aspartyl-tRNA synthetase